MAARWGTPSGHQWQIESGSQRATIVEIGGGLRGYSVGGEDVVAGYPADKICSKGAGQVLAPWPNRIRDGRYSFGGATYQLPLDEPVQRTAIHGLVRWEMWDRLEHTPSSVTVARTVQPRPAYPFALVLRTTWSVGPDGLRAEHEATNVGGAAAPFGLGVHPFLAMGGGSLETASLRLPTDQHILLDERQLPSGVVESVKGTPYDFRAARPIADTALDTPFVVTERAADGIATSTLTGKDSDGRQVTHELWQDAAFGWLQVYNGKGPSGEANVVVAVEPMTCPPDAFNSGTGLIVLEPGERWTGTWGIRTSS
jgi:aldose 1-epimerase